MMSRTMTEAPLPKRIDAFKLVEVNQQLKGKIESNKLTRLVDSTRSLDDYIECEVEFGRDEERLRTLTGKCSAGVVMECQRCLGDVRFEISAEFRLGLVFNDDQAKALPKRLEPVELDEEGRLDLWDVIEDELLLNLPDFPMHPQDECQALKIEPQEDIAAEETERPNPFDVLAQLKQK